MTTMPKPPSSYSGNPQNSSHVNPLLASTTDSRQPLTSPPPLTATATSSSSPAPVTAQALPVVGSKASIPPLPPQTERKITRDPSSIHPSQHQGILYPVASSGRGFIPKSFRPQSPDQLVTIANHGAGGFPPRSLMAFPNQVQVRPIGFPTADPQAHSVHVLWPSHLQPSSQIGPRQMGAAVPGTVKSVPAVLHCQEVAPFPSSSPDLNCYEELRDRGRDDTVVTIHDRKVRLSDGASLYALCRSWVWNGFPQETQPPFGEGVKLLPRPLPVTAADTHLSKKDEAEDEEEEKEKGLVIRDNKLKKIPDASIFKRLLIFDVSKNEVTKMEKLGHLQELLILELGSNKFRDADSVEHVSPQELLQRHIKRAKRVRARLREERLQRIARYKQRLALLLPLPVEQLRNDATPGS